MNVIGLLGGSFNPAHGGHRSISLFAIKALALDEMWWMVSPGNPLKTSDDMASLPQRLASAHEKTRRAPIKATAIERSFGTRYTVDTLKKLKRKYPRRQFIWIMGADNLAQFHRWHQWREIAKTMPIAVIERPGYNAANNKGARFGLAMAYLRKYRIGISRFQKGPPPRAPALIILRFLADGRSASEIRLANPTWYDKYKNMTVKDAVTHRNIKEKF